MCGRYVLTGGKEGIDLAQFGIEEISEHRLVPDFLPIAPRYNAAPTQVMPVVTAGPPRALRLMRWGLIPSWAKDRSIGARLINARSETLVEKPAFREAFKRRRCLVPADGFFEWRRPTGKGGKKVPHYIRLKHHPVFAMAGLWEEWVSREDGEVVRSFTIITTAANELVAPLHDRMPVILPRESYGAWLAPVDENAPARLLRPFPAELMETYPVADRVGRVENDDAACIEPYRDVPGQPSLWGAESV